MSGETVRIVTYLFPGVTQLDFTGPAQVFVNLPGAELHFAAASREPVMTDAGFAVLPTTTFTDAPSADVIFVPGGGGVDLLLEDDAVIDSLRWQAQSARWVTSVCTGSLVLGAAGLLNGRRATSHWASIDLLAAFGAIPTRERVVRDGLVVTGAGVSSGIDFALTLAAEMFGDDIARRIQLGIEYDPHPPFDAGSPSRPGADPGQVERTIAAMRERRGPIVAGAAARLRP